MQQMQQNFPGIQTALKSDQESKQTKTDYFTTHRSDSIIINNIAD